MLRLWRRWASTWQQTRPCVFCDRSMLETNGILYEDDMVMAFRDKHPRATAHILVVPKKHIGNTVELNSSDESLVEHMKLVGSNLLDQERSRQPSASDKPPVFGFHQPPFNSIDHLHLHCLLPPFLPAWNELRYVETRLQNFVTVESLLRSLHNRPPPKESI